VLSSKSSLVAKWRAIQSSTHFYRRRFVNSPSALAAGQLPKRLLSDATKGVYSARSASCGAIKLARMAGTTDAINAAKPSTTTDTTVTLKL